LLRGFCRIGAHCLRGRGSIWLKDSGSGEDLVTRVFSIPRATLFIILWGFITPYLFILIAGRVFLKEGAPGHRDSELWGSYLQLQPRKPIIGDSHLISFRDKHYFRVWRPDLVRLKFQEGFQPERGTTQPEDSCREQKGRN
jgi:hypothetical protein